MKSYTLTIRVALETADDPAARDSAAQFLYTFGLLPVIQNRGSVKLQETFPHKAPRKVRLEI